MRKKAKILSARKEAAKENKTLTENTEGTERLLQMTIFPL